MMRWRLSFTVAFMILFQQISAGRFLQVVYPSNESGTRPGSYSKGCYTLAGVHATLESSKGTSESTRSFTPPSCTAMAMRGNTSHAQATLARVAMWTKQPIRLGIELTASHATRGIVPTRILTMTSSVRSFALAELQY